VNNVIKNVIRIETFPSFEGHIWPSSLTNGPTLFCQNIFPSAMNMCGTFDLAPLRLVFPLETTVSSVRVTAAIII
jgi:hypothetical protein